MKYAVVYEKTNTGYSAYVPDLPGCIAAGRSLIETRRLMQGAISMHLQGMREDGEKIPSATTQASYVVVSARTNGHRKKAVKSTTRRTANGRSAKRK